MGADLHIRHARADDAEAMARIHAEGIADRVATFETRPATAQPFRELAESIAPVLVAEIEDELVGWAKVGPYADAHDYYATVGEATLYVRRKSRGAGVGAALLTALGAAACGAGFHKLVGKILTTNEASVALVRRCGWSEVGVHRRHGRLDGAWKDVLVVEKLFGDAAA